MNTSQQPHLLRSSRLVEFVDIFPTLVEAAGNIQNHDNDDDNSISCHCHSKLTSQRVCYLGKSHESRILKDLFKVLLPYPYVLWTLTRSSFVGQIIWQIVQIKNKLSNQKRFSGREKVYYRCWRVNQEARMLYFSNIRGIQNSLQGLNL